MKQIWNAPSVTRIEITEVTKTDFTGGTDVGFFGS
jgi:hypothetical protein